MAISFNYAFDCFQMKIIYKI